MDGSFSLQDRVNTQPWALENTTMAWRQTTQTAEAEKTLLGSQKQYFFCAVFPAFMWQRVKVVTLKATFQKTDTPELIASCEVLRTGRWCLSCIHPKVE